MSLCRFVYIFCIGTALDQLNLPWGPKRSMTIDSGRSAGRGRDQGEGEAVLFHRHGVDESRTAWSRATSPALWQILTKKEERPSSPPKCLLNVEVPHPDFVTDRVWLSQPRGPEPRGGRSED